MSVYASKADQIRKKEFRPCRSKYRILFERDNIHWERHICQAGLPVDFTGVTVVTGGFDNVNHITYMDNFYSSYDLFVQLQRKGIDACEIIRANRTNMTEQLKPENMKLKRGDDTVFMLSDNIVAAAWQDLKRVTSLSTVHTSNTYDKVIRQKGNPT